MGGERGRTIYFDARDFSVYVRKHPPVKLVEICEKEERYQKNLKDKQKLNGANINLWR